MNSRRRVTAALIGLLALVAGTWATQQVVSVPQQQPPSAVVAADLPARPLSELPPQVADIWQRIQAGGPFEYRQDGTVFGNREGLLPTREPGYYREYTVPTPGAVDRGARRLVTGQDGALYYTDDHYESFVVVEPDR